jgi:prevent-host-death family protein
LVVSRSRHRAGISPIAAPSSEVAVWSGDGDRRIEREIESALHHTGFPQTKIILGSRFEERARPMRVSVKELLRNFSRLSDKALSEPVIITKNGRDRLVLVSIEEYLMLSDMTTDGASSPEAALDPETEVEEIETKPKRA